MHISESKFRSKSPLIQRIRDIIRSLRMSPSTEEAYVAWAVKFIFHFGVKNPAEMGGREVTEYLSWLATEKKVAAATQNQAFNALLFLYNRVLEKPLENIKAERARREPRLPGVLTKDEVNRLMEQLTGDNWLMAMIGYGCGLRLMELLRLRVKDMDFGNGLLSAYLGKGRKSRIVPLPKSLHARLKAQIEIVKGIHNADLADGFGAVWLPDNLALKYPKAPKDLGWQYLFPSRKRSTVDDWRGEARHHLFATSFQQELARAGKRAGLTKRIHPHVLRHTHATHLLEMGRSLIEVRDRLGHKDVKTTQIYLHCVEMKNAPSPADCLCSH